MKTKLFVAIILISLSTVSIAQQWVKNIKTESPTFYDIQKAFNDYWTPFNVKGGKYLKDGKLQKAYGWKQFKRWEWYWQPRVGPSGVFPKNTVIWDEYKKQKNSFTNKSNSAAAANWTSMGPSVIIQPGEGVGRINCIGFHPTDANIFWVGTPAGGMWKTTDGGSSWTTNTDDLPVLGVSSIAIHPTSPNTIYIATGDGEGAYSLQNYGAPHRGDTKSIGILKSIDGGNTWVNVMSAQQSDGMLISRLIMCPNTPDSLYAATNQGVYRTFDGGSNWTMVQAGYFMDIEFHPTNSDILYAATFGGAQVYVSTDAGQTWTQTTNFANVNRINIEVSPANPNAVDLLCSDSTTDALHSLQSSLDTGQTWTQYYTGGPGTNLLSSDGDASGSTGQGFYDLAFAIDPNDWNNVFVGGVNTFKTIDRDTFVISSVWTEETGLLGEQVVHADKHFLTYHPFLPNTIFECNDGGVFKSTDNGVTWINLTDGITIGQFYSISNSQTVPSVISGGLQDNGSIISRQGAWPQISSGDGMITHIDYSDTSYVYSTSQNGVLYRIYRTDMGFDYISDSIPGTPTGAWVTPYVIDPTTPTTLIAGFDEVYRTTDRGDSWTKISDFQSGKLIYLTVAKTNSNYIYAATDYEFYKTDDLGATWTDLYTTLTVTTTTMSAILVDQTDENTVIATFSGYDAGSKVYKTIDAGTSWTNITYTGLPNLPVNCVEIDQNSGDIYVGTDMGVYVLSSSNTWVAYNSGLPNVVVIDLDIQYSSAKLRAGTFGRGIWESDLNSAATKIKEVGTEAVIKVYPNPSDGSFQLNIANQKELKGLRIVNNLGQLVWTNKSINSNGTYDFSGMSAGVYFVIAEFKDQTVKRKFIVK